MSFFKFGTFYPLYRYEIVHITIQKENGKRKAFILHKEVESRDWFIFFSLFLFFSFFCSFSAFYFEAG